MSERKPSHPLGLFSTLQQRGSALPHVILTLSLIGYITHRLTLTSIAYNHLARTFKAGAVFQSDIREQLATVRSTTHRCEEQIVSGEGISQRWYVCGLPEMPFTTSPPVTTPLHRVDFDALFRGSSPCPGERTRISVSSFTSPVAPNTCTVSKSSPSGIVTTDNIETNDEPLVIESSISPGLSTPLLASPGKITIRGDLSVDSDVAIVAGGDLNIESITYRGSKISHISLISAHGDIVVGNVGPRVTLFSIGRQGISVPQTAFSPPYPLPPATRSEIAGIEPASDP